MTFSSQRSSHNTVAPRRTEVVNRKAVDGHADPLEKFTMEPTSFVLDESHAVSP